EALRGKPEEQIARPDIGSGEHAFALDRANYEAGEIIFARSVEARHFGGFAANERATVVPTAAGDAGDDTAADLGVELANGKIVEKKQRLRALDGDVVDAVINQIFANGVMAAGREGNFELGADAIGGTDKNRIPPTL